jgi:hypothetical protein
VEEDQYWHPVTLLNDAFNNPMRMTDENLAVLANTLASCDLQRQPDLKKYVMEKRDRANQVKAENSKRGDEMLMAAVDALSSKQIQNFIDVHRAMHTGETIVAHGADEASLGRMLKASEKSAAEVPVNKALNQGMHPLIYRRTPRNSE